MRRRFAALALVLLVALPASAQRRAAASPACAPGQPPTSDACVRERLDGLDAYVNQALDAWRVPGLALAVVRGNRIVYEKGYGVRERGRPERVDENTTFAVASNSKALTAASLGILVDQGKLTWDSRVAPLLPGYRLYDDFASRELTVRDLLSHRAGYQTWGGDLLWYGSTLSQQQVLDRIRHLEPVTSFRSSWGYSNLMFHTGGMLLERLSDTTWADFVAARFLGPLGMTRTTTTLAAAEALGNRAMPHTLVNGQIVAVPYRPLDAAPAAAAFNSSVHDWSKWLMLNVQGGVWNGRRLISEQSLKELRVPHSLRRLSATTQRNFPSTHFVAYGLGWDLRDYRSRLVVSHTGGMDGMLSQTGFVPEDSVGVVVLTNYDEASLYTDIFWHVMDRVMAGESVDRARINQPPAAVTPEPPPARALGTRPSLPLDAYTGTYRHPMLGTATVAACPATGDESGLCVSFDEHPGLRGPLVHWHHDVFEARWADPYFRTSLLPFDLDREGRVLRFRVQVRPDFVDPKDYAMERVR